MTSKPAAKHLLPVSGAISLFNLLFFLHLRILHPNFRNTKKRYILALDKHNNCCANFYRLDVE